MYYTQQEWGKFQAALRVRRGLAARPLLVAKPFCDDGTSYGCNRHSRQKNQTRSSLGGRNNGVEGC